MIHALNNRDAKVGEEDLICVRDHGSEGFTKAYNFGGKSACCVPCLSSPISDPKIIAAPLRGHQGNQVNVAIPDAACLIPAVPLPIPIPAVGVPYIYYPDLGNTDWPVGVCINTLPVPNGLPTYPTMLACCNEVYEGQPSGEYSCIYLKPISYNVMAW